MILIPGAGGSQFLPRLIGRRRAMEYILSGNDISAVEAAEIGWINKAFDTTEAMNGQPQFSLRLVLTSSHRSCQTIDQCGSEAAAQRALGGFRQISADSEQPSASGTDRQNIGALW